MSWLVHSPKERRAGGPSRIPGVADGIRRSPLAISFRAPAAPKPDNAQGPGDQPWALCLGVSDGTRTRDVLDHNQVLYQLSYTHRGFLAEAP